MSLGRLRTDSLERIERALIRLFSADHGIIRGITEEFGERVILGSLAIYAASMPDGGKIYVLAYNGGGWKFPIFLEGWGAEQIGTYLGSLFALSCFLNLKPFGTVGASDSWGEL